jgi:hypothetical protein
MMMPFPADGQAFAHENVSKRTTVAPELAKLPAIAVLIAITCRHDLKRAFVHIFHAVTPRSRAVVRASTRGTQKQDVISPFDRPTFDSPLVTGLIVHRCG